MGAYARTHTIYKAKITHTHIHIKLKEKQKGRKRRGERKEKKEKKRRVGERNTLLGLNMRIALLSKAMSSVILCLFKSLFTISQVTAYPPLLDTRLYFSP